MAGHDRDRVINEAMPLVAAKVDFVSECVVLQDGETLYEVCLCNGGPATIENCSTRATAAISVDEAQRVLDQHAQAMAVEHTRRAVIEAEAAELYEDKFAGARTIPTRRSYSLSAWCHRERVGDHEARAAEYLAKAKAAGG